MTAAEKHTWDAMRDLEQLWAEDPALEPSEWLPFGIQRWPCGCLVNGFDSDRMWRPCRAHESSGHLAVISERPDGMHVASCQLLTCPWSSAHFWENDAVLAAQQHWKDTAGQEVPGPAGSN